MRTRSSTARGRSSSGSRGASCPPTRCRPPTSALSSCRAASPRRRPTACCIPASRSPRTRRAGEPVTIERSRRVPARRPGPRRLRRARLRRVHEWREEDEPIAGHPRDPFHRVDVRRTSRPVRIELGGAVFAESTRARLVFETRLPTRFYLPREDVSVALRASARRTYCPYKGEASYWSVDGARRRRLELRAAAARHGRDHRARRLLGRAGRRLPRRRAPHARRAARSPTPCATSSTL